MQEFVVFLLHRGHFNRHLTLGVVRRDFEWRELAGVVVGYAARFLAPKRYLYALVANGAVKAPSGFYTPVRPSISLWCGIFHFLAPILRIALSIL